MLNQKISLTFDLQRFTDTQINVATGNTVLSSSAVSLSASQIQAGTLPVTRGGTGQTDLSKVTVGTATSANSATTATTAASLTTARALQVSLNKTSSTNFQGNGNVTNIGVQGVLQIAQGGTGQTTAALARNALGLGNTTGALPVANGGTGLTANPSMLTNLGTTTAANVLQASPRPGVTGTLPVANGGTGQTVLSAVAVGAATKATQDGSGNVITSYYTPLLVTPTIAGGSGTGETICNIPSACTNDVNAAINLNMANFNSIKSGMYTCQVSVGASGAASSKPWFNVLNVKHRNGQDDGRNYGMIFYSLMQSDSDLYWRHQFNGAWKTERKIIDSSNIGSQTVAACTGNALTASSLQTARSLQVSLNKTSATNFQGNANVTNIGVQGVLQIAQGGTGQTTAAAARNALGLGNTTGALPVANGGTGATVLSAVTVGKATTADSATTATTASSLTTARSLQVSLNKTSATNFQGNANVTNIGVQGILGTVNGGTGAAVNPSMLTNLGSTTAAAVFAASPRPGITGTLGIANGGTGATNNVGLFNAVREGCSCLQAQGRTLTNPWHKVAEITLGASWADACIIFNVTEIARNGSYGTLMVRVATNKTVPDMAEINFMTNHGLNVTHFKLERPAAWTSPFIVWCYVPNANQGKRFTVIDCFSSRDSHTLGWTLFNNPSGGTTATEPTGDNVIVSTNLVLGTNPTNADKMLFPTNLNTTAEFVMAATNNYASTGYTSIASLRSLMGLNASGAVPSANQDGSGNVITSTYVPVTLTPAKEGTTTGGDQGVLVPVACSDAVSSMIAGNMQNFATIKSGFYSAIVTVNAAGAASGKWFNVINNKHRNGSGDGNKYGMLLYSHMTALSDLYWRQDCGGTWQTEKKIIDSSNIGSQTVASANALKTARTIDGVNFNGSANITHYGTCSTAAGTAAKTVACTGFVLGTGARITVKFTVTNTAANPTLNVNSTGAKAIYYRGYNVPAAALQANSTYDLIYNGAQYDIIGSIIWVTE